MIAGLNLLGIEIRRGGGSDEIFRFAQDDNGSGLVLRGQAFVARNAG
jgi:hypothetical protein